MKVLGIVAEYNPFHNGHLYHIEKSRSLSGANCVVVVMSGNFTQRGEPAIVDKWARAEIAVECGADLVIELPCVYAMSSAEYFAFGAVKILDSLNIVDVICFGSECGSIEKMDIIAAVLADEPDDYKQLLKASLSKGLSFPAARQEALSVYLKENSCYHDQHDLSNILESSNNILGIEYLKALRRLNSSITPMTIRRTGSSYNSAELSGKFSSATSIRNIIAKHGWNDGLRLLDNILPEKTLEILRREFEAGRGPVLPDDFSMLILSSLRKMTKEELRNLPYMEYGLYNRFKAAAEKSGSFEELLDSIATKRYPVTRIQRILFSLLTGLNNDMLNEFNKTGGPSYIRILGFNNTGRELLQKIKDRTTLPIITKAADFKNSQIPRVSSMLSIEAAASDQYVLAFRKSELRKSGSEFTRNIFYKNI